MTIHEVADLLFAARERIDFYWNFHVVVVVALVGWLVALKRPLTLPMKLLVSVIYVVASSANALALHSSYTFAEALRTDLLRVASASPLADTRVVLEQHSYIAHRSAALWIHVALALAILGTVWFARLTPPEPAISPEPAAAGR